MNYFQRPGRRWGNQERMTKHPRATDSGGVLAISGPEGAGRGGDISAHRATALREAAWRERQLFVQDVKGLNKSYKKLAFMKLSVGTSHRGLCLEAWKLEQVTLVPILHSRLLMQPHLCNRESNGGPRGGRGYKKWPLLITGDPQLCPVYIFLFTLGILMTFWNLY